MSRSRLGVSLFLVAHLTAITIAALPPPDTLRPFETPPHPENNAVSRLMTPMLDTVAEAFAAVPAVLWAATSPIRPVADTYVQTLGIGQHWRMFWDVPTFDVYFRVRWYIQTPVGSIWTATELVYPAHREDRIRLLQAFRDSYRDKAFELMFNGFVERRSPRLINPGTRPQDLPDQLTPIVRYFGREFAKRHLVAGERVTRTEVWRGTAPNPAAGPNDGLDSAERQRMLRAYYDGPVEQRRVSSLPAYHAGEKEADVVWVLEYLRGVLSQTPSVMPGADRWTAFWFREIPPHIYAALRIMFGLLGIIDLLGLTPIAMFWAVDGLAPIPGGGLGIRALILQHPLGGYAGWVLYTALFLSFAAMTAGYRSRWAVAASFAGTLAHLHWNSLPLSSAHEVRRVMLFCLLWADCGRVWSLDAIVRAGDAEVPAFTQPIWPLRLLQFQVSLIYLSSGLWKLSGPAWRDGSALHYALNVNTFARMPGGVPPHFEWLATVATYGTLFWEIGFAFMVLHPRLRRVALVTGIVVHIATWLLLEVGIFSWVMLASYVAFIDPEVVRRKMAATEAGELGRAREPPRRFRLSAGH